MTSKDDQPTPLLHPEYAPTQEEGPTELARHSVSSSEDKSSSHSGHDPEVIIAYESQSSIRSDITFPSHVRRHGGDDIESDVRTSTDHGESSGSLTFHPPYLDRTSELDPGGQQIGSPLSPPSHWPGAPEIREATSSDNDQDTSNDKSPSEVSISNVVSGPMPLTSRPNRRKRVWLTLKGGCGSLRKRLCRCLSPKAVDDEAPSHEKGHRIKDLDLKDGILHSSVEMNSLAAQEIEQVIQEHGGLVVLTGEKLLHHQRRLNAMLKTCFDRRRGREILRLWKMDAVRPSRLYVEMLPSTSTERRFLTLEDVRLLSPPREDPYDRRDDSLFRYFMSYEGLSGRMLIPGRG